ncbi:MAG: sulfotransferase, partial [Bacteroidota bacterium]
QNILLLKPDKYADLCGIVCMTFAQSKNKFAVQRWGDKNNYYIQKYGKLHSIFPDAKFILIIRDGRDVACSYKNVNRLETASRYKPDLPDKIEDIANKWLTNNQNILNFFDLLPQHQKHILKYENLIIETESELKSICKFLEIDFSNEMLNYYLHNRENQDEPAELIDWKKKTMEKPDAANSGKYKNELLPEEIKSFNSIAGTLLKQFNYEM